MARSRTSIWRKIRQHHRHLHQHQTLQDHSAPFQLKPFIWTHQKLSLKTMILKTPLNMTTSIRAGRVIITHTKVRKSRHLGHVIGSSGGHVRHHSTPPTPPPTQMDTIVVGMVIDHAHHHHYHHSGNKEATNSRHIGVSIYKPLFYVNNNVTNSI